MLLQINSAAGMDVLVETRSGTNYLNGGSWTTFGTYSLQGQSGWNDIPLILSTLGGATNQTSNNWQLRLTFIITSLATNRTAASIMAMRIYGNNYSKNGHIYTFDANQNVTFPGTIAGTLTEASLNNSINQLSTSSSNAQGADYLVAQYAGGGTTTTTYHRRPVSKVVNKTVVDTALGKGSDTTKFYRNDGTWAVPSGAGDVVGPNSATSGDIATFSGTTGKVIQDSGKAFSSGSTDTNANHVVLCNDSRLSDARPASNTTSTYSSTGTDPVNGTAVASAFTTETAYAARGIEDTYHIRAGGEGLKQHR